MRVCVSESLAGQRRIDDAWMYQKYHAYQDFPYRRALFLCYRLAISFVGGITELLAILFRLHALIPSHTCNQHPTILEVQHSAIPNRGEADSSSQLCVLNALLVDPTQLPEWSPALLLHAAAWSQPLTNPSTITAGGWSRLRHTHAHTHSHTHATTHTHTHMPQHI